MPSLAPESSAVAYPVLGTLRAPDLYETVEYEPELDSATFLGTSVEPGGVLVARLRGVDLEGGDLRCTAITPGYRVELLPMCTRQGTDMLVGVRFVREVGARSLGCEVRFSAGTCRVSSTVMVHEPAAAES